MSDSFREVDTTAHERSWPAPDYGLFGSDGNLQRDPGKLAQVAIRIKAQRDILLFACHEAIRLAQEEGIDKYRGTDDERDLIVRLRGAIAAAEEE